MAKSITFTQANGQLIIHNAKVMFDLSAYDKAESTRQNLVLAVEDSYIETVQNWESVIDPERLSSSLSQYGLRTKVSTPNIWRSGELVEMPGTIRGRFANVKISLNGVWHTKKNDGLCLLTTDIEFLDEPTPTYPF